MTDEFPSPDSGTSPGEREASDAHGGRPERWRGNRRRRSFVAAVHQADAPDADLPVLTEVIDPAATAVAATLSDAATPGRTELASEWAGSLARQLDELLPSLVEASLRSAVAELRKGIRATVAVALEEWSLQRGQDRRPPPAAGEDPEPPMAARPGQPPHSEGMGDPL